MNKKLLVGISVVVLLGLVVTSPVWGQKCKQVTVVHGEFVSYLEGPENCDGYDGCWTATVKGTPNGLYTTYWYWADLVHVGDDTFASIQHAIIETAHGDIHLKESVIVDYGAPDGYAIHTNVVGGTGRYEGATGWLGAYGDNEGSTLRNGGEICFAEED